MAKESWPFIGRVIKGKVYIQAESVVTLLRKLEKEDLANNLVRKITALKQKAN